MLTKEQQKKIALKHLEQLKLKNELDTYTHFKDDDGVYVSLHSNFGGILLDIPDELQPIMEKLENKGFLVYHIVETPTEFGDCYAFLYVSNDENDEELTENDLEIGVTDYTNGQTDFIPIFAYVYNATYTECSEFGTVGVVPVGGGLLRKY